MRDIRERERTHRYIDRRSIHTFLGRGNSVKTRQEKVGHRVERAQPKHRNGFFPVISISISFHPK